MQGMQVQGIRKSGENSWHKTMLFYVVSSCKSAERFHSMSSSKKQLSTFVSRAFVVCRSLERKNPFRRPLLIDVRSHVPNSCPLVCRTTRTPISKVWACKPSYAPSEPFLPERQNLTRPPWATSARDTTAARAKARMRAMVRFRQRQRKETFFLFFIPASDSGDEEKKKRLRAKRKK